MTDEVLKRLDALAAKLGVASAHLWEVLTRQARIEAIEDVFWALMWLTISVFLGFVSKILFFKKEQPDAGLVVAIVSLVCFVAACGCISNTPGMFFNPEYWALKQILDTLKK